MRIESSDATAARLAEYSRLSIAFEVRSVLECELLEGGLGGIALTERPVAEPYVKDYDAIEGEGPTRWARRFDVSRWRLFFAREGEELVGGAVVVLDAPGVNMLEGRRDLAVLWDFRVHPDHRGQGIGARLFDAAIGWAAGEGAKAMKVETQNTNVPACRFYASRGCELGAIDRFAYPGLPEEVQLLWYRKLSPSA